MQLLWYDRLVNRFLRYDGAVFLIWVVATVDSRRVVSAVVY